MKSSERSMQQVREFLRLAHQFEVGTPRNIELADACGAIAANKLAIALRQAEREDKVMPIRKGVTK